MEAGLSNVGQAAVLNALRGVFRNQQMLAEAIGVELPFSEKEFTTVIYRVCDEPRSAIKLPSELRRLLPNDFAFNKAVERGYVRTSDESGLLEWTLGNNTLLAYFCGRLFCGDRSYVQKRKGKGYWRQGKRNFPAAALDRLFGALNLKKLRQNRDAHVLPKDYELVDNLF